MNIGIDYAGGVYMPASKRIIVTVPEALLFEMDTVTISESKNRSEIVREAIRFYLGERRRYLFREQMKKGYLEMAEINLRIACENIGEEEALVNCIENYWSEGFHDKKGRNLLRSAEPGGWLGTRRD